MPRVYDRGQIELTRLRNYRWEVTEGPDGVQVTETYIVTDEGYSAAPEGQQRRALTLSPTQQGTLSNLFNARRQAAATREQVALG